jgi:hypothetical protein
MREDLVTLMDEIQENYLSSPFFGYRRIKGTRLSSESQMCFTLDVFVGIAGFIPEKEFI